MSREICVRLNELNDYLASSSNPNITLYGRIHNIRKINSKIFFLILREVYSVYVHLTSWGICLMSLQKQNVNLLFY